MNRLLRQIHKYLSLGISIQLLLWTISGIYFSFNNIGDIRGEQYLVDQPPRSFSIVGPQDFPQAQNISYFYRLDELLVSAQTDDGTLIYQQDGSPVDALTEAQVKTLVEQNTTVIPDTISLLTEAEPVAEFRGRALPIYRIDGLDRER